MSEQFPLPRSAPEAQGIASQAIGAFVSAADRDVEHLHSLMLVRHGHVLAEGWWAPYRADSPHMLFSLSKSFTSTAVGMAVDEGRLSIDDPVLSFFPDDAPAEVSDNLAAMRVRHLLAMCTGHDVDTMQPITSRPDGNWVRGFLACPVQHAPGTHFLYNTGATYMLSAIVQKLTGETLLAYLGPRLFEPLGIAGASWESCPRGINTGGFGLRATTEAIAKFGQLYLQHGVWNGRQLVPAAWVAEATAKQIDNAPNENPDWAQGYGYQFWRCQGSAYRGDGAFGQFCIVLPEHDAVLAITAGVANMQAVLNLVWQHILPALGPAPLPADPAGEAALRRQLAGLALPLPQGPLASPLAEELAGTYTLEPNPLEIESIGLEFGPGHATIKLRDQRGEHPIRCGAGAWVAGITTFVDRGASQPIVAAGVWASPTVYQATLCYTETPFQVTLRCELGEGQLLLDFDMNVSFGPTSFKGIAGRRV